MRADGKTAFDAPPEFLEAQDTEFLAAIKDHGWSATWVFDPDKEGPDFSYTTGFDYSLGAPEIVLFSLPNEVANSFNWGLWDKFEAGARFPVGEPVSGLVKGDIPLVFLPMAKKHYEDYLGRSRWFYGGDDFECLIMYWPDPQGRFPWQAGFDQSLRGAQPDLTEDGWPGSA